MNNTRFNIGDKVVALTNPLDSLCQHRVKYNIYTVQAISYCKGCGVQRINIGGSPRGNTDNGVCICKAINPHNGLGWTRYVHFALVSDIATDEELENELSEIFDHEKATS